MESWQSRRQISGLGLHHSRCRLLPSDWNRQKAFHMLPRSPLYLLLPATLLALPYLLLSKTPAHASLAENLESSPSSPQQQFSSGDKYTLRGVVVNSATSEPIRGALVQIYFNGQNSMLTGPDGKFQFE